MGLKGFERRLERLVEGVFARAFKSSLRPVELGRRLVREMDDQRTVNVQGGTAAPNDFTVTLGPDDHAQFAEIEESLTRELSEAARTHAREEGYVFMGPVEVGYLSSFRELHDRLLDEYRAAERTTARTGAPPPTDDPDLTSAAPVLTKKVVGKTLVAWRSTWR